MTEELNPGALALLKDAKEASLALRTASAQVRDDALAAIAETLASHVDDIVAANAEDLARGHDQGMSEGLQDRLRLTPRAYWGAGQLCIRHSSAC